MTNFDRVFVATHVAYRNIAPYDALEGPYSSVCNALTTSTSSVYTCQIPLYGWDKPILYERWKAEISFVVPKILGNINVIKYVTDMAFIFIFAWRFCAQQKTKRRLLIGSDPLACLPLVFLKPFFQFTLVFYAVDFNRHRFANSVMQWLYEKADEISTKQSDQTWVVCESLQAYKKNKFGIDSYYIPNSSPFTDRFYKQGKPQKQSNKLAWTGSCVTPRQFEILFNVLRQVKQIAPHLSFYFAPTGNHDKFREYCKKYKFAKATVLELHSRKEWQQFASTCDVGIAVYDDKFGSTEFIEPLKIWDFMLVGMPFIISCEPSISTAVKTSGVAYLLKPANKIPDKKSLQKFLQPENLAALQEKCVQLAKEYSIKRQIEKALNSLQLLSLLAF